MGPLTTILYRLLSVCYAIVQESYYATEACLVLYKCFAKETVPKCGGLLDFSTTCLLTMHAYTHARCCSWFESRRKTTC